MRLLQNTTKILAFFLALAISNLGNAQGFSGSKWGEIYRCTSWYEYGFNTYYYSFLHFDEYGKKVEMIHYFDPSGTFINPDAIPIGNIVFDSADGILYNYGIPNYYWITEPTFNYRSFDSGHSWTSLEDESTLYDVFWTFAYHSGILIKKYCYYDFGMAISEDFGNHFDTLAIPILDDQCVSGWDVGEFFRKSRQFVFHTNDFFVSRDTITIPDGFFVENGGCLAISPEEGNLFIIQKTSDFSRRIDYTTFYGQDYRTLIEFDSIEVDEINYLGRRSWAFLVDREPGVFYSYTCECPYDTPEEGTTVRIKYYRSYGDTLVTTYVHRFAPDWFSHHTPIMDCKIVNVESTSIQIQWSEPELKPDEHIVGYRVYRNNEPIFQEPIMCTEFTDYCSFSDGLEYYVIAIYDDETESQSYNIVYCNETLKTIEQEDHFEAFPNPSKGSIVIAANGMLWVEVYDMSGQILKKERALEDKVILDISPFMSGIYFIKIINCDGIHQIKKIVKY